jgi:hypothetical protein
VSKNLLNDALANNVRFVPECILIPNHDDLIIYCDTFRRLYDFAVNSYYKVKRFKVDKFMFHYTALTRFNLYHHPFPPEIQNIFDLIHRKLEYIQEHGYPLPPELRNN